MTNQGTGGVIGLHSLYSACRLIYPDQPNPLQVTARLKYWLGGPDPLDYISMYWNPGNTELHVPPHWHYVSFGLSDLHGDGRVHPIPPTHTLPLPPHHPSGFGMELTMRVIGDEGSPPTWPAALLQRLATYIFATGNCLYVGDHVSWHNSLDGVQSAIQHMLVAQDPQLQIVQTPLGTVHFVQIVGVTGSELRGAQRCGGAPILAALAADLQCGGPWLVTDMRRSRSVDVPGHQDGPSDLSGVAAQCRWEPLTVHLPSRTTDRISSEIAQTVKEEIKCVLQRGLSEMVSSDQIVSKPNVHFDEVVPKCSMRNISHSIEESKMSTDSIRFIDINNGNTNMSQSDLSAVKLPIIIKKEISMSTDSFKMSDIENALLEDVMYPLPKKVEEDETNNQISSELLDTKRNSDGKNILCSCNESNMDDANETSQTQMNVKCGKCRSGKEEYSILPGVHLIFDREAASLLPLAIRGRVIHGSHFTWSMVEGGQAITFLGATVSGALATTTSPIVARNGWLQILVTEELAKDMAEKLQELDKDMGDSSKTENTDVLSLPRTYHWDSIGLIISVVQHLTYNTFS